VVDCFETVMGVFFTIVVFRALFTIVRVVHDLARERRERQRVKWIESATKFGVKKEE